MNLNRSFASPKLTMGLLAVISGFLVLGNRELFYSPVFLTVVSLFLLNLGMCTWRQLKRAARGTGTGDWGSVVTHTGLLVIVLGALIKLTFDFSGVFSIPEGGFFDDRQKGYSSIARGFSQGREYGQFKLFLQEVKIKSKDKGVDFQGLVSLVKDGELVSRQWIRLGQPLSHGLWNFYYSRPGYYVSVTFQDKREAPQNYLLRLDTYKNGKSQEYKGEFEIYSGKYILAVSYEPKNLVGNINLTRISGNDTGQRIYTGLVPVGGRVELTGGEKLTLVNSIPAIILTVKKEPGLYVVYTGFFVTMIGIFILMCRQIKTSR